MGYHSNLCYFQEYGSFHFYSRCVTVFTNDDKSWVHMDYAVIQQSATILFFVQSLWCLKICIAGPLIIVVFSLLGNKIHSDTRLIVSIFTESCHIWEQVRWVGL